MAGVDDTEAISLWVGKYDEVGVRWVQIPPYAGGAETDQTLNLGCLFGRVVNDKVKMNPGVFLGRRF